jgi:GxxExxY protein
MGIAFSREAALTERVINCVIRVHGTLGPGFVESVYKRALVLELRKQKLTLDIEKEVTIHYDGHDVGRHRLDLVVEDFLIVELKAVETITKVHYAQVRSYMKASGLRLGLLVNFADFSADFRRIESR